MIFAGASAIKNRHRRSPDSFFFDEIPHLNWYDNLEPPLGEAFRRTAPLADESEMVVYVFSDVRGFFERTEYGCYPRGGPRNPLWCNLEGEVYTEVDLDMLIADYAEGDRGLRKKAIDYRMMLRRPECVFEEITSDPNLRTVASYFSYRLALGQNILEPTHGEFLKRVHEEAGVSLEEAERCFNWLRDHKILSPIMSAGSTVSFFMDPELDTPLMKGAKNLYIDHPPKKFLERRDMEWERFKEKHPEILKEIEEYWEKFKETS